MTGPPMSIELVSVYKPFALSNARPIPIAWRDPVKKILEDMVTQCIIALVTEPTVDTPPCRRRQTRRQTPHLRRPRKPQSFRETTFAANADTEASRLPCLTLCEIPLHLRRQTCLLADPTRRGKPAPHYVHHSLESLQIPPRPNGPHVHR